MSHHFFMPMEKVPTTTHQQKQATYKNGKMIFYEPESLKNARLKLMGHLSKHKPEQTFDIPLSVTVKWFFPRKVKSIEWKDTKPDTHNLNKLLFDCMTDLGYWTDDALVVSETIQKFNVPKGNDECMSGIYIGIDEVGGLA